MQLILFCGGSDQIFWPLSNDARSKPFLPVLAGPRGEKESMIQRVVRQIQTSGLSAHLTIVGTIKQLDSILSQLGESVDIVTEPEYRNTFPSIALASYHLSYTSRCSADEVVVVMPCDIYADDTYSNTLSTMARVVGEHKADVVLMGIPPTSPSGKSGYIVPESDSTDHQTTEVLPVKEFTVNSDVGKTNRPQAEQAMRYGGVAAFRLGYLMGIAKKYVNGTSYEEVVSQYAEFPHISFEKAVLEGAQSMVVVPHMGIWKELRDWNSLCEALPGQYVGKVVAGQQTKNVHVVNELNLPIFVEGIKDAVVAVSADGIMIASKESSGKIQDYVDRFLSRPMYEERRWGTYRVLDAAAYSRGQESLTKTITLQPGKNISYQRHHHRSEVWIIVDGNGEFVLDGKQKSVVPGDVLTIPSGFLHGIKAGKDPLTFIEVQMGTPLIEEDIERYAYQWKVWGSRVPM